MQFWIKITVLLMVTVLSPAIFARFATTDVKGGQVATEIGASCL